MLQQLPYRRRITLAEYLALEAFVPDPLEYRERFGYPLTMPTKDHARIVGNLVLALGPAARASGCDFYAGDASVPGLFGQRLVPDFIVTCDDRSNDPDEPSAAVVRHPTLVIEVVSPGTAANDLTAKLNSYLSLDSLQHYVLIASHRRLMHAYEKLADGRFATRGDVFDVDLPWLGASLSLDDVYRDTAVPDLLPTG
jgi:Uma2 family endonuclease